MGQPCFFPVKPALLWICVEHHCCSYGSHFTENCGKFGFHSLLNFKCHLPKIYNSFVWSRKSIKPHQIKLYGRSSLCATSQSPVNTGGLPFSPVVPLLTMGTPLMVHFLRPAAVRLGAETEIPQWAPKWQCVVSFTQPDRLENTVGELSLRSGRLCACMFE